MEEKISIDMLINEYQKAKRKGEVHQSPRFFYSSSSGYSI